MSELISGPKSGIAKNCQLVDIAMIPYDEGFLSWFTKAFEKAQTISSISVINCSAGVDIKQSEIKGFSDLLWNIRDDGILPVSAIGPSPVNCTRIPACLSPSLTVSSIDAKNELQSNPSHSMCTYDGNSFNKPDLVAPGINVISSINANDYEEMTGSSFAAPIISGLAILLLEQYGDLTPDDLQKLIIQNCIKSVSYTHLTLPTKA